MCTFYQLRSTQQTRLPRPFPPSKTWEFSPFSRLFLLSNQSILPAPHSLNPVRYTSLSHTHTLSLSHAHTSALLLPWRVWFEEKSTRATKVLSSSARGEEEDMASSALQANLTSGMEAYGGTDIRGSVGDALNSNFESAETFLFFVPSWPSSLLRMLGCLLAC